jgi:hypothetical protein
LIKGENMESQPTENEQWAVIDLMGHAQTSGRISRPADWGGLLRVDVPDGDNYRTEYYGMASIYSIKLVSKEIASAYAHRTYDAVSYDSPIVTREQHENAVRRFEQRNQELQEELSELRRRLTAVRSLPEPLPLFQEEEQN